MRLVVVSDLHLWGPEDPLCLSLRRLLCEQLQPGDVLVIAGDLFDLFVGNKKVFIDRYQDLLSDFESTGQRGVRIHYIEGNHDFLVRRVFRRVPGMHVHARRLSLELEGKRFFIAHGDMIDCRDWRYRLMRTVFRSPFMKLFVALAPGETIDRIGSASSRASERKRQEKFFRSPQRMKSSEERTRKAFRNFAVDRLSRGYDFVVLGHSHDADEMCFSINGRPGQYINTGFGRTERAYLTWSPGEGVIRREGLPVVESRNKRD